MNSNIGSKIKLLLQLPLIVILLSCAPPSTEESIRIGTITDVTCYPGGYGSSESYSFVIDDTIKITTRHVTHSPTIKSGDELWRIVKSGNYIVGTYWIKEK